MTPVLLDTGAIVALLDSSDTFHAPCAEAIAIITVPLITCEAAIAESCYLLRKVPGAREAVLDNVVEGVFQIPMALPQYAREVRRVLQKYRDRGIDLADACLVQLANEFGTGDILTLDRDFRVYRWGRNNLFRPLIPLN